MQFTQKRSELEKHLLLPTGILSGTSSILYNNEKIRMKESSWPRCHLVHVTVPMSVWFTSIHPIAALPCTHWWPNKADGQRNWLAVLSAFPSHPVSLQMKGWCNQFCAFVCSVDSCSVNGSPLSRCLSLPRPIEMAFLCDGAGCGSSPLLCSPLDPRAGHSVWEPCAASLRPWQKRIIQISQLLLEETPLSLSLLLCSVLQWIIAADYLLI